MAAFDCAMIPIRDWRVLSNAFDGSERTEAGLATSTQKVSLLKWRQEYIMDEGQLITIMYALVYARP